MKPFRMNRRVPKVVRGSLLNVTMIKCHTVRMECGDVCYGVYIYIPPKGPLQTNALLTAPSERDEAI